MIDWRKYFISFVITIAIFATAIFISNYLENQKIADLKAIQDQVSVDILSSETQYSLLEQSSCTDVASSTIPTELGTIQDKLTYSEQEQGKSSDILALKQEYSLLEIKDYLLTQKIFQKCGKTPLSIIYFYSTDNTCADCQREGYVLDALREQYPTLRVYSFDYNLDNSAEKTLIAIMKVKNNLPAMVVKGKVLYGFQSVDDLQKAMPELKTATTSK